MVRDDDAADAFGAPVRVECVVCCLFSRVCSKQFYLFVFVFSPLCVGGEGGGGDRTLFFDILSLPWPCSLCYRLRDHSHELAIARSALVNHLFPCTRVVSEEGDRRRANRGRTFDG